MANTVQKLFKDVEALRVELGVSIEEAAQYVGVTPLAYSKWKRFWNQPSARQEDGLIGLKRMLQYGKAHELLPVMETDPRLARGLRVDILRGLQNDV